MLYMHARKMHPLAPFLVIIYTIEGFQLCIFSILSNFEIYQAEHKNPHFINEIFATTFWLMKILIYVDNFCGWGFCCFALDALYNIGIYIYLWERIYNFI